MSDWLRRRVRAWLRVDADRDWLEDRVRRQIIATARLHADVNDLAARVDRDWTFAERAVPVRRVLGEQGDRS